MYIKKLNVEDFKKDNSEFNAMMKTLVKNIFETEGLGEVGYVISEATEIYPNRFVNVPDHPRKIKKIENEDLDSKGIIRIDEKRLGLAEKLLLSSLSTLKYTSIILTGALGSGKTSICEYVLDYIKENANCKSIYECQNCSLSEPIVIYMKFTSGVQINNASKAVEMFSDELYARLVIGIRKIFYSKILLDEFKDELAALKPDSDLAQFDQFYRKVVKRTWDGPVMTVMSKSDSLMEWIDERKLVAEKLNLLALLLSFIRKKSNNMMHCMILCFDNIDRHQDDVQLSLLKEIFGFAARSQVKTLVPLRLINFSKATDCASYSFGHIEHFGFNSIGIIKKRVEHFLRHKHEYYNKTGENYIPEFMEALEIRMKVILDILNIRNSRLAEVIDSIAGNSIRRGLFLAERMILNNVVKYNSGKKLLEEYCIRALLDPDATFDRLVTNIFMDKLSMKFTTLHIRILQYLHESSKNNSQSMSYYQLELHLASMDKWGIDEVLSAINDLLNVRRRLIWIDGVAQYKSKDDLQAALDDKFHITPTGKKYITSLIKNMNYFQECFYSMDWDDESIAKSVNFNRITERFKRLKEFLKVNCEADVRQLKSHYLNISKVSYIIKYSYAYDILLNCSGGVLRIIRNTIAKTKKQDEDFDDLVDELKNWISFIVEEDFRVRNILCECYNPQDFEALCDGYEGLIQQFDPQFVIPSFKKP